MTASWGSHDARYIEPVPADVDPTRPDHLVVWLHGRIDSGDDQVIDDQRLDGHAFSIGGWAPEVRAAYPESVFAATYPPHPSTWRSSRGIADRNWLDLTRTAAGIDAGSDDRAFTGDTTPTSLRYLRGWAIDRLADRLFPSDDIVLAVSELSTNVERHGGDWLTVDLVDGGDVLVLAVTDPETDLLPEPKVPRPEDPSGRGLLVVATVAARWGVVLRPTAKTVWAAFPRIQ